MAIAKTIRNYLDELGIDYEILPHPYTNTSLDTARLSHIPGDQIAKSVILEDEQGYLMAVIPATHHLAIGQLSRQLDRRLGLATEGELAELFNDCDLGAIPPLGEAYRLDVVVDDLLDECDDVYFEAGDHIDLVHVSGEDFRELMHGARHGQFSQPF